MNTIPEELQDVLVATPDTCGGQVRFKGARIPAYILFDFVFGGETLESFLEDFPNVPKESAQRVLAVGDQFLTYSNLKR